MRREKISGCHREPCTTHRSRRRTPDRNPRPATSGCRDIVSVIKSDEDVGDKPSTTLTDNRSFVNRGRSRRTGEFGRFVQQRCVECRAISVNLSMTTVLSVERWADIMGLAVGVKER